MTLTMDALPKAAKALPAEGQQLYVDAYNADFGWRCSEAHAEKAAWRAVAARFPDAAKAAAVPKAAPKA
jgi:cation transport regulator ChaB